MIDHIKPVHIANTIKMKRTQYKQAFLIVEGAKDSQVFTHFIDQAKCKIEIAFGRENVEGALAILNNDNCAGILGVRDADFSHIVNDLILHKNLATWEVHDLECAIIQSKAFEKLAMAFFSPEKYQAFDISTIRGELLNAGAALGYLRLHSKTNALALSFDELKYENFVNRQTLSLSLDELITEVKNKSQAHGLDATAVVASVKKLESLQLDKWQLCCGHDLINILSVGLRKRYASRKAHEIDCEALERALRLAYEYDHFKQTLIYQAILSWQNQNTNYTVLR